MEEFAQFLYYQKKLAFHPDDDFAEYISAESHHALFSNDEIELYNRLTDECFEICEAENEDIYEVMGKYNPFLADN